MASLESTIESIFVNARGGSEYYDLGSATTPKKYIEIPIQDSTFELPIFAFRKFRNMADKGTQSDAIVAQLFSYGNTSHYRSLEAIMKEVLSSPFSNRLWKIEVPGSVNIYYGTAGAVFNEELKPIMMMSWLLERVKDEEGNTKYAYKRPIMRLHPMTITSKDDALIRWLGGRFLTNTLNALIGRPFFYGSRYFVQSNNYYNNREYFTARIEIDKCPFIIRGAETPSVSTTNEDLLQVAEEYLQEVLQ